MAGFIVLSILFTYLFGAQITYRVIEKGLTKQHFEKRISSTELESKLEDKKLVAAFWPFFFFLIWAPRRITVKIDNFIEARKPVKKISEPKDNTVSKGLYR